MTATKQFIKYIVIFCFSAGLSFAASAKNEDPESLFAAANKYYQQQDYENALNIYLRLEKQNYNASEVLYNAGNCYYKSGKIGKAILYYERAAKLNPDDEDIHFNLKLASLKTVDKIEPVQKIFYKRWSESIMEALKMSQWSIVFLILVWIAFIIWGFYLYSASVGGKKISFYAAVIITVLCILTYLSLNASYHEKTDRQDAIVLSASSYVKSAPDERGNDQFILHEGTKVEVLDELGSWKKIRIANGSVGWLPGNNIELI